MLTGDSILNPLISIRFTTHLLIFLESGLIDSILIIELFSIVYLSSVLKRLYYISCQPSDKNSFYNVGEEIKIPHEEELKESIDISKATYSNFDKLKSTSELDLKISNDEIREANTDSIIRNKLLNTTKYKY